MAKRTLVLGSTGDVGKSLIRILANQGVQVRSATRHPEAYPDRECATPIHFDLEQPSSFAGALADIDSAYVIPRAADPNPKATFELFFDQAKKSGVSHIVFVTALGVHINPKVGVRQVENLLKNSGLAYTILRPAWFMQNFCKGITRDNIARDSEIRLPAGEGRTSFVSTDDVASVAAEALTDSCHAGKEYAITGGECLSYAQVAAIMTNQLGRTISYRPITNDEFRQTLLDIGCSEDRATFRSSLYYPVQQGWTEAVSPAVSIILKRPPIGFRQFVESNAYVWNPTY